MDKLKMQSPNLVNANITKIAELFPNCITEDRDENGIIRKAVDFDQLSQELSARLVEGPRERYTLSWPGKNEAILTANAPIAKTLRPCEEESVDFENTKNIYIEGDNLDALKLLQETYLNTVDMMYIDQPYNTGNDFIYEDDFAEDTESFLIRSNQKDEAGNRLVANTDSNGRFHSDWLSMMYPRLKLERNLLRDDGVIFISIDDNEVHNLRKVCDEVFGEDNFAADFVIKSNPRGSQSTIYSATVHEHLICYVKNSAKQVGFTVPLGEAMESEYNLKDGKEKYRLLGLRLRGGAWRREERPLLYYPIYVNPSTGGISLKKDSQYTYQVLPIQPSTGEDGTWRWSKGKLEKDISLVVAKQVSRGDDIIWDIFQKDYLHSNDGEQKGTKPKTIWDEKDVNYQNGSNEIKSLFNGKAIFNFPKPTFLIKKTLEMIGNKNAIILDIFSGSATTAHAVMQLNAVDGGNRRFIMVQLPEPCDEKSEASKAGYKTIADIGKERIRRAGKKIKEENPITTQNLDVGFRVFKVDTSNMKDVYYTPDELKQGNLELFKDHIKPDRRPEDLLFQVFLDWGIDLSLPIAKDTIDGKTVFFVDTDALMACFDSGITEELVKKLAKHKPMRAVFRDDAFGSDSVKINVEQIFKLLSPTTEVKSI